MPEKRLQRTRKAYPQNKQERLMQLARIGAEYNHWDVGDEIITYGYGHDETAPHECQHADCKMIREMGLCR